MTHTCRTCKRTFPTEVQLELHRDSCSRSQLFCEKCGGRYSERSATTDGWHYRCPDGDCGGEGLGEDLRPIETVRLESP